MILFSSLRLAAADGAKIFKQNCASCHSLTDQKLAGPGMKGVMDRIPQGDWLKNWIKNSSAMVSAGDAYAVKVFNENNKSAMTAFESILSNEEIDAVITFLKNPVVDGGGAAGAGGDQWAVAPDPVDDGPSVLTLLLVILGLLVLATVLSAVRRNLQNAVNIRKGLQPEKEYTVKEWLEQNKRNVALIILVLLFMGSHWGWYAMKDIGVFTGYKPSQPIAFSHAVHAGQNQINCEYCHSGVSKSKVAGVPSAGVCMNCHKAVSTGTRTGTDEIAKIYAATGWNPQTMSYDKPAAPIKWNRVHALPDFVFFSHKQHVVAGKQECKTCHGDLTKMDVAKQVQPLTMAWCVDCHRTTAIPGLADNPYYESLHKNLTELYKGQPITVDKMGGLECAKCHY
ncbi:MAG: c-type cytochrome [Bacteroidia bacterium]|nr:c-type cytochrome [Bacteroidia bacterium]